MQTIIIAAAAILEGVGAGMMEVPNQATAKTETALATQGGLAVAAREDREVREMAGPGAQEVGGPEVQVALEVEVREDLGQIRAPTHEAVLLDVLAIEIGKVVEGFKFCACHAAICVQGSSLA